MVFLGFPIWWGIPPKIMRTFAERYDWNGKTIVPFCTNGGSGFSSEGLTELTEGAEWKEGRRFRSGASASDVMEWIGPMNPPLGGGGSDRTAATMTVQCGDSTITFELNESTAAQSLLKQLPLTVEVEPFSTNEQTFYPPEKLDVTDTPAITSAEPGTLAYYAPWG